MNNVKLPKEILFSRESSNDPYATTLVVGAWLVTVNVAMRSSSKGDVLDRIAFRIFQPSINRGCDRGPGVDECVCEKVFSQVEHAGYQSDSGFVEMATWGCPFVEMAMTPDGPDIFTISHDEDCEEKLVDVPKLIKLSFSVFLENSRLADPSISKSRPYAIMYSLMEMYFRTSNVVIFATKGELDDFAVIPEAPLKNDIRKYSMDHTTTVH